MRDKLNHKTLKWLPSLPVLMQESFWCKLQALVYGILPSTTTVFSYATGPRQMSANEQFFCWCSDSSTLLQTTEIRQTFVLCSHFAYASLNKTKIVWIDTELSSSLFFFFFFTRGGCPSHVYVRAWALGCFHSLISTQTFRRALTASVDSCAEIKSVPSVV